VANDDDTRNFARYLNDHPDEAKRLQAAVRSFIQQYKTADSLMVSVSKQLADVRQMAYEAIKSTFIPTELFTKLAKQLDTILPANWPRPIPSTDRMEEVLEKDGIPIVHIPRAEIVQAIVDADDYDARIEVIEERADDIAVDCSAALAGEFDDGLEKQIPLVRKAIEAYQAEHFEAAQALAVSVCDKYLKMMFPPEPTPRKKLRRIGYAEMAEKLVIGESEDTSATWAFNIGYALAPAVQFLVDWRPEDGEEPPSRLSRHVSIHFASTDHMNKLNATVAIMLATGMSMALNYPMMLMRESD
jgi:hypothetical protein